MKTRFVRLLDWYLIALVLLLLATGIATIYTLTIAKGQVSFAYNQSLFALGGILLAARLAVYDYRKFRNLSVLLYITTLILLIGIFFFGKQALGATRWLDLGLLQFQPSELMKISLVLILAKAFSGTTKELNIKQLATILILSLIPIFLVIKQPDLGTAGVLTFCLITMLLSAKISKKHWLILIVLAVLGLFTIALTLKDYQLERIQTWLNPTTDPYDSGYNVIQSLIAIGNGGMIGKGLGQGTQSQLEFLPVAHTDFIFAGIAEASGLVGSSFLILIFAILIIRTIFIAKIAIDNFGSLLSIGIACLWFVQFAINLGMTLGLAPVTGIPLPFVSYGGTALIINFIALGLLESIVIRSKRLSFQVHELN